MPNYLTTVSEDGPTATAYKIVEAKEFFKLINEWLDFDNEPGCQLSIIKDDFEKMVLVDGCSDNLIAYGVNGIAVSFDSEEEIKETLKEYVAQHEKVILNVPKVLH